MTRQLLCRVVEQMFSSPLTRIAATDIGQEPEKSYHEYPIRLTVHGVSVLILRKNPRLIHGQTRHSNNILDEMNPSPIFTFLAVQNLLGALRRIDITTVEPKRNPEGFNDRRLAGPAKHSAKQKASDTSARRAETRGRGYTSPRPQVAR